MRRFDKVTITKSTTHIHESCDTDITLTAKIAQSGLPFTAETVQRDGMIKWECLTAFEAIEVLSAILMSRS